MSDGITEADRCSRTLTEKDFADARKEYAKTMSTKERYIRKLQQLPNEILDAPELYFLDIIELKGQMQHNSWLADRYKKYRELSPDEDWLRFKLGNWSIIMETWGD